MFLSRFIQQLFGVDFVRNRICEVIVSYNHISNYSEDRHDDSHQGLVTFAFS